MIHGSMNKKLLSIVIVAIIVISLSGITYALLNYTRIGLSNSIEVGRIVFNTSESRNKVNLTNISPISSDEVLTDNDNVGVLNIDISGDTTNEEGVEYLLTAVGVNNTINNKTVPISIVVTYEEKTGKDIGTSDSDYFVNRGGDSSIYKVLASNTIVNNDRILVGYIKPDQVGIDGVLTIRAYVDSDNIIVSDDYSGITDKVVLTTQEWNSLSGNNALSFQVKVEAQQGVWVAPPVYTVTFNLDGGTMQDSSTINISGGSAVESLPTPTKTGYTFDGWYLVDEPDHASTYNVLINTDHLVNRDEEYIAGWVDENDIVMIGRKGYAELQLAFNDVPTTGVETEIRVLKSFAVTQALRPTIDTNQNVKLVGNGYTISCGSSILNNLIYVKGTLTITSGTLTCNEAGKATLETLAAGKIYIRGGTISQTKDRAAIYNNGKVYVYDGATLTSSAGDRAVLQNANSGARITIYGGTIEQTSSSCKRGAIQNISGAYVTIEGGEIISNSTTTTSGSHPSGIQNDGNLVIGTQNGVHNTSSPIIKAKRYGVDSSTNYSFYDGIIKGITAATNNDDKITSTESGLIKQTGTEIISSNTYNTLWYAPQS